VGWKLHLPTILRSSLEVTLEALRAKILNYQTVCDVTQFRLVNSYPQRVVLPSSSGANIKQEISNFDF